jgi:cell division protein FtsA
MIKIELDKAGISTKIPSGVVVTGGGAETVGITDSAKRMMSLPVRIGKPKGISGLIDDVITPSFAVPVGLILYGAKLEPKENLNSFGRRIKLPSVGFAGKIISAIKNLLP